MFKTPILFLVFNRLETTKLVFEKIKKIEPAYLFIAADGPRINVAGEKEKCEEIKRWLISNVSWPCDIKTLFRTENMGCKYAVSSGINWFFEHVEEGIILEDDCLPNESFFTFCQTLLEKYRLDQNIMHIGGNNFQQGITRGNRDYYFSVYNHIWGWATWRRAWQTYDVEMKDFNEIECNKMLVRIFEQQNVRGYWSNIFNKVNEKLFDTWDYQWTYRVWKENGLAIVPQKNLVSNIGFFESALHTSDKNSWLSNLETSALEVLKYPSRKKVQRTADNYTSRNVFNILTNHSRTKSFINKLNSIKKKLINE